MKEYAVEGDVTPEMLKEYKNSKIQLKRVAAARVKATKALEESPEYIALMKLEVKYDKATKRATEGCLHPVDKLENYEDYYEGSYYDKAYTRYWNSCTLCGKISESSTKTHSWYG